MIDTLVNTLVIVIDYHPWIYVNLFSTNHINLCVFSFNLCFYGYVSAIDLTSTSTTTIWYHSFFHCDIWVQPLVSKH